MFVGKTKPENLDKKKLRYIFRRVLKRMDEKPNGFFKFRKMRGTRGLWWGGDLIEIDHRKEIIPTIIHEVLHDLYENNSETWVRKVESKISQILNAKDIYRLMKATFTNMNFSE